MIRKAIEHLEIFKKEENENGHFTATSNLLIRLLEEIEELLNLRKSHSDSVTISAMKEINQKWIAICKRESSLSKEGFSRFIKDKTGINL